MQSFDASTGQCLVRVYREGLAAAVGHDLVLEVGEFSVEIDADTPRIRAKFQADSLRVLGTQAEYAQFLEQAKKGDTLGAGSLSGRDKSKIESSLHKKVLQTHRFPVIRFESTAVSAPEEGGALEVRGALILHGVERAIRVAVEAGEDASVARARLHQPDFDIAPFRALMGALKIKPDVEVELRLALGIDALKRSAGGEG